MQRKDWLPSFLTFYLTFLTLNIIISKYFSNIVILVRFADVELPCRYAVIKSLLLLLLLLSSVPMLSVFAVVTVACLLKRILVLYYAFSNAYVVDVFAWCNLQLIKPILVVLTLDH